ncbi:MAG: sigma-54-dependent Fis family transcriptional regulator [Deltaproteobacteria bacterium]|nr:sigma-54-dependent Fis family transcriptional regulator [Deltaproteobacteria bacterium]
MTLSKQVLVIDDDRDMCELLQRGLSKHGFGVEWHLECASALSALAEQDFGVVVTDLKLGQASGLSVCERLATHRPNIPVVVITAFGSMESAIAAIRVGAYDFITKPLDVRALALTLERAIQHATLREEVTRLRRQVEGVGTTKPLIGDSSPMRVVYDLVDRVSTSDVTVLVTGESGTGKELVARSIHERSERRDGPFVAINCAAVPATLLESELFGHVRGAFTDAKKTRDGLFLEANHGTLLLDEIGEMPIEMQPKLLRAIQERKVRPVGSNTEREFDTRIIASTHRDLELNVAQGRFREDLYYRINVVHIPMPPLRERGHDILLLAQDFVARIARRSGKPNVTGLSDDCAAKILDYEWPGNVRELENCIERAVTLTRFAEITVEDLPEKIRSLDIPSGFLVEPAGADPRQMPSLEDLERRYIHRVLAAVGGNKTQAAMVLGLDRRTLYRKLDKYARDLSASSSAERRGGRLNDDRVLEEACLLVDA